MEASHSRNDISNRVWVFLESRFPGRKGSWGGRARDNRLFINAVFWILRTGVTCLLTMGSGRIPTAASAVGETKGFGKAYWKSSLSSLILNGS